MKKPSLRRDGTGCGNLAAVQRMMAGAIMQPLGPRERMQRGNGAVASALIKRNERLSCFSRLQIYNQQYWWRLQGALLEDFPGLRAVLGIRRFDRVRDAYLASRGSTSWNLRDLGQHLESFLREHPALAEPFPALALEMAQVEWARVVAFDGPEEPRLDPQSLTGDGVDPSGVRIGLQPYLTLLELAYPIDRMLGRLKEGRGRIRPASRLPRAIHLAVHRQEFSVYYKRLEAGEFQLLKSLRGDMALEAACGEVLEKSGERSPVVSERIQAWFASWMQLGWLCGVC